MAGKTEPEAVEAFLQPLRRAISCVLRGGIHLDIGGGYHQSAEPHVLALASGEPIALRGASRLHLTVQQQYRIVEDSGPRGPWKCQTVAYNYAVDDTEGREVIAFHWHPRGPSSVTAPHLHVGPAVQVGAYIAPSTHVPTGRVSLEEVLRLAITEFGVEPARDDWVDVLDETQTATRRGAHGPHHDRLRRMRWPKGGVMLRCEECGKQAQTEEEARRWRAYLTVIEEEEPEEVVVCCPDCAQREFERDNG